jgi:hypothetical protein
MEKLFKHGLLRRYLVGNLVGTIISILLMLLWCFFWQSRRSGIVVLFAFPVFWGTGRGIFHAIKSTLRLASAQVEHIAEISLKLSNGCAVEKHSLPCSAQGTCMLFFQSSRNLIEGGITLKQVTPSVIRETPVRLRPGWRKIARGYDITPVEFVIDGVDSGEVFLDFDLRIFNRNLFRPNLQESEKVLVLLMKECMQTERRAEPSGSNPAQPAITTR